MATSNVLNAINLVIMPTNVHYFQNKLKQIYNWKKINILKKLIRDVAKDKC